MDEVVQERLTALLEGGPEEAREIVDLGRRGPLVRPAERQPDHLRIDLRPRAERSRAEAQQTLDPRLGLAENRQAPVALPPRRRQDSRRDLSLHHHQEIGDEPALAQEPEDRLGRDVERKVSDDPGPP